MLLEMKNISFRYPCGKWVLKDLNLQIEQNERVGLIAPSGYGKSTLVQIIAGYLKPTSGEVLLDQAPLPSKGYCPVQLVYQHPEKALNPRLRLKKSLYEAWIPDDEFLEQIGIEKAWLDRFPTELSGGELQRFCIARALGKQTKFLLADEMTAMLDVITQAQIWELTLKLAEQNKVGLLVVTHNTSLAERICTRIVDLREINRIEI